MANNSAFKTLKRSQDFANLKEKGRRIRPVPWLVVSALRIDEPELHCGWTLSRKVANSVYRNRLKRWCREFFRQKSQSFIGWKLNIVFMVQPKGFYRELEREVLFGALERSCKKLQPDS